MKLKYKILASIPPALRYRIVEAKNACWGGYKQTTYAHCAEDVVVDTFFRNDKEGFYVDVGAHHPFRYSNTALLYKRGWKGINIDADKKLIDAFNKKRVRDINLHYGVGLHNQQRTFHAFSDPAVSTFSAQNVQRLEQKKWLDEVSATTVHIRPLADILDQYLPEGVTIDFLNIDVEDLDLEVLQSNNWQKYQPRLVAVEDLEFDIAHPQESKIYNFLINEHYVFLGYIGLTLLFVEEKTAQQKAQKKFIHDSTNTTG